MYRHLYLKVAETTEESLERVRAEMLEQGGDVLELLGAVEARVVEVLYGQLAHQHVVLEARHGSRREITRGVRTPANRMLLHMVINFSCVGKKGKIGTGTARTWP